MGSIRERLLCAEEQYFAAIAEPEGTTALEDFSDLWIALCDDVDLSVASRTLDEDTLSLAAAVATRIEGYASSFEAVLSAVSSVEANMKSELEDVFSQLVLDDTLADSEESEASWDVRVASTTLPICLSKDTSRWPPSKQIRVSII